MRPLSRIRVPVKVGRKGSAAGVFGPQLALPLTPWAESSRRVPEPSIFADQPPLAAGTTVA